jgi:tetratricopeptide (TPR) repeat protein
MALVQFCRGQFKSAREHYEKSVELLGPRASGNLNQIALAENSAEGALGLTLAILGYPGAARARHRSAIATARRDSDPFLISMALALSCVTEFQLRDAAATEALAEDVLAIANEHGFLAFKAAQTLFRGWAIAISGRAEEGIDQMRQVLPRTEPPPMVRSDMKVAFAEVCAQHGLLDESLATIENGLAEAQRNAEAEFHRVRGEVMLLKVPHDEAAAQRSFRTSIEVARTQEARLYELRTTVSLARLLDRQGKRNEARATLAEIYGWFTEGFDARDLKDAKALLAELSA